MVINTNVKVYEYYCTKCEWSEQFIVKFFLYRLLKLGNLSLNYLPAKCPKCGAKIKRKRVYVQF